ncbi:MAG: IS4 family transposase, partial [Ginsengibacter sp.]
YTQIWIAISVYVLIAIIKKELNSKYSLNQILQILSVGVFEKIQLNQAFTRIESSDKITDTLKQLILFDS